MTDLRVQPLEMPAALIGPEDPLPVFRGAEDDIRVGASELLPEEDRKTLGWGAAFRVLPHRMLNGYTRDRPVRPIRTIVLENEWLRATFAPEMGGRLLSLVRTPEGRELLDRNPVFQPANLALRNAWFSGGVEWNAGHFGHHYLTCSPVFAARVEGDGYPVLRLYEWERVKRFPWQIDFHLPPGSRFLFARVRLLNPRDEVLPVYWWTNIAVPERPGHRVLVNADTAIHNLDAAGFGPMQMPLQNGLDISYPADIPFAREFFFRIEQDDRKWIASVDAEGRGLVQTSTDRLRGRKLFCWGNSSGGRRWQEYLAAPGCAYIEIQAGLARTQLECVPMPARAEWAWTEAFGMLEVDSSLAHGADWASAVSAAAGALESALPRRALDEKHAEYAVTADREVSELLSGASGWAALERRRAIGHGDPEPIPSAAAFADHALGPDQQPWLALLERGALPRRSILDDPGAYMAQPEWQELLERSVLTEKGDHWYAWLHLGVMRLENRDVEGARAAWERSLALEPSGWALRNLAVLEQRADRPDAAIDLLTRAWQVGPPVAALAIELARALMRAQRWQQLRVLLASLPTDVAGNERLALIGAQASLETGDLETVPAIFDRDFATIREGEIVLSDLWFRYHEARIARDEGVAVDDTLRERVCRECPPPNRIDFRMAQ